MWTAQRNYAELAPEACRPLEFILQLQLHRGSQFYSDWRTIHVDLVDPDIDVRSEGSLRLMRP
jgi:hypothetical protein